LDGKGLPELKGILGGEQIGEKVISNINNIINLDVPHACFLYKKQLVLQGFFPPKLQECYLKIISYCKNFQTSVDLKFFTQSVINTILQNNFSKNITKIISSHEFFNTLEKIAQNYYFEEIDKDNDLTFKGQLILVLNKTYERAIQIISIEN